MSAGGEIVSMGVDAKRAAHTPAPWHAGATDEDADIIYDVDDNPIAYADQTGSRPSDKSLAIDAANARLIAAAPDLAEALRLLTNGWKYSTEVCNIARAALAKAGL
jgi:hypothetical protein